MRNLYKGSEKVWPHLLGQLHHGDQLDALGSGGRPEALCAKAAQHVVLRVQAHVLWHLQPALLILGSKALVVGVQEVLQLHSGLLADHCRVGTMVEHVGEGLDQLQKNRIAFQSITSAEENRKANLWQITLSSTFKEGLGLLQLRLEMGKRVDLLTRWECLPGLGRWSSPAQSRAGRPRRRSWRPSNISIERDQTSENIKCWCDHWTRMILEDAFSFALMKSELHDSIHDM